jgi:hypothetical protein
MGGTRITLSLILKLRAAGQTVSDVIHAYDAQRALLLLPLYLKARAKNRDFSLDLQIFSADSLEKPNPQRAQADFFELLNARVQLSRERRQTCSKCVRI